MLFTCGSISFPDSKSNGLVNISKFKWFPMTLKRTPLNRKITTINFGLFGLINSNLWLSGLRQLLSRPNPTLVSPKLKCGNPVRCRRVYPLSCSYRLEPNERLIDRFSRVAVVFLPVSAGELCGFLSQISIQLQPCYMKEISFVFEVKIKCSLHVVSYISSSCS